VVRPTLALTLLGVVLSGALLAGEREAPGIAVGADAPALQGKTWFTADGKAPAVTGKVYLVDFWFGR
jgi:hypothetical protein